MGDKKWILYDILKFKKSWVNLDESLIAKFKRLKKKILLSIWYTKGICYKL